MRTTDRPPSPVESIMPWRDESLEKALLSFLRSSTPYDQSTLDAVRGQLDLAAIAVARAEAEARDIEADWSSSDRDWYHWGLREIRAERAAIRDFRTVIERANGKVTRLNRELNRERGEIMRREAVRRRAEEEAEREARKVQRRLDAEAFLSDRELRTAQSNVIRTAYQLGNAPAEEWGPDTPFGLELRAALSRYTRRKEELRAAPEETSDPSTGN